MFKVKQLAVTAAITLFAGAAMASNFRAADQVYVPAAGHASSSSATFVSDIFISNLSDDSVDISVILATGTAGTQTPFPKILTLLPRERRELRDFVKNTLNQSSALGQLIFNACKATADCTPDPTTGLNANYRNISVESRIYSVSPANADANTINTAPTTGQLFSGIPWYNFVSESASGAGLDKIFITGIRNTAQYRTNMGFVNASQFSTTTITATLFSGSGSQLAQNSFTLQPLGFIQPAVGSGTLFPSFVQASTSTGAYVVVQQGSTNPTPDAAANGCPTGCPAFFAFGSTLDNQTNDPTTLEPQYLQPLTNNAITCIYSPDVAGCNSKGGTGAMHRAVKHQF
ncbi:MAG TPA: hypothetical protein VGQ65_02680 [Thermoanaerobaculia bacterium]|jgi:hypothetical protein|nr:hypothetical protein [Thermoanaerobaculia bacterium]